ncbi:MAG: hypothetical protein FWJ59_06600 [Caldicoprobacter sp.]|uniref:hypothetical protein n=1 Tax=Caldicoprobacter sp. TaxID=2004500 RepID=UPI0039C3E312
MGLIKQGLKLMGTHAIVSLIQFIFIPPLLSIFENQIYQWLVGLVCIAMFWLIVYADMSKVGLDDAKKDAFAQYKGFIAGLLASIPSIILYLLAIAMEPSGSVNWFEIALRLWLIPYTKIFTTFDKMMPHIAIIPIALFPMVAGISYIDGLRKRKQILKAIENSEATRAERSKVNISFQK